MSDTVDRGMAAMLWGERHEGFAQPLKVARLFGRDSLVIDLGATAGVTGAEALVHHDSVVGFHFLGVGIVRGPSISRVTDKKLKEWQQHWGGDLWAVDRHGWAALEALVAEGEHFSWLDKHGAHHSAALVNAPAPLVRAIVFKVLAMYSSDGRANAAGWSGALAEELM